MNCSLTTWLGPPSLLLLAMIWKPHDSEKNFLAASRVIYFLKIGLMFHFGPWFVALVVSILQRKGQGKIQEANVSRTGLGAANCSSFLCSLHRTIQARNCTGKESYNAAGTQWIKSWGLYSDLDKICWQSGPYLDHKEYERIQKAGLWTNG